MPSGSACAVLLVRRAGGLALVAFLVSVLVGGGLGLLAGGRLPTWLLAVMK